MILWITSTIIKLNVRKFEIIRKGIFINIGHKKEEHEIIFMIRFPSIGLSASIFLQIPSERIIKTACTLEEYFSLNLEGLSILEYSLADFFSEVSGSAWKSWPSLFSFFLKYHLNCLKILEFSFTNLFRWCLCSVGNVLPVLICSYWLPWSPRVLFLI